MIRKTVIAVTVGASLVGAAAANVPSVIAPKIKSTAGHYLHNAQVRPDYVKGAIAKNCLRSQGECMLVVQ